MMDAIQRSVIVPKLKIAEQRAAWWQVLGDRPPLAAGAQDVHQTVHHVSDIDVPLAAAAFGRRDQWRNMSPFIIRHITRVTKPAAIIEEPRFSTVHIGLVLNLPRPTLNHIRAPLRIRDLTEDDWLNGLWPSAAMLAPGFPGVSRAPIGLFPLQDRAQAISYSEYCHTAAARRFSWTRRRML